MKKILNIFLLIGAFVVVLTACEDTDTIRIPEPERVVSMRLVVDTDFLDALDIPNATLEMSVYTEVSTISTVDLYVDYFSFSQDSTYDRALVATISGTQFDSQGIIENFVLTSLSISDAVGIDIADMSGGDRLDFAIFTTLDDGRVYPDSVGFGDYLNVNSNILNATGTTSLTTSFTRFVACPVPNGYLLGDYSWEHVSGPTDPFFGSGPIITEGTVTISATSPIGRTMGNLTYATFGGGNFNFLLVCNNVLIPYTPAPASCGGGLGWTGDAGNIFVYDDADDSEILLNLFHNPLGDCGLASNDPWLVRLTKL
jgi:hypothetical protein